MIIIIIIKQKKRADPWVAPAPELDPYTLTGCPNLKGPTRPNSLDPTRDPNPFSNTTPPSPNLRPYPADITRNPNGLLPFPASNEPPAKPDPPEKLPQPVSLSFFHQNGPFRSHSNRFGLLSNILEPQPLVRSFQRGLMGYSFRGFELIGLCMGV